MSHVSWGNETFTTWDGKTGGIISTMDPSLLPPQIPVMNSGEVGQVIAISSVDSNGVPTEFTAVNALPDVDANDEGKILLVNSNGEWETSDPPTSLPEVDTDDSGKALIVAETGEWDVKELPKPLPETSQEDKGKILQVNENGNWQKADFPKSFIMQDTITGYSYILEIQNGNLVTRQCFVEIRITTPPDITSYYYGEPIDVTGMVVEGVYGDGSSEVIENYTYPEHITDGTKLIVSYTQSDTVLTAECELTIEEFDESLLVDFEYIKNNDGTYELTAWKGTTNGVVGTEIIIPNNSLIII